MKRFAVSILMPFMLLFANMGIAFHIHYCSGEIASFDAVIYGMHRHADSRCCDGDEKHSCCSDDMIETADQLSDWAKAYTFIWVAPMGSEILLPRPTHEDLAHMPQLLRPRAAIPPDRPLFQLYSQYILYA